MVPLSVVIVSFNTKSLLVSCLQSLYEALSFAGIQKNTEVIVVDNASTDNSPREVRKLFPAVTLIENKMNMGFSKANNLGIAKANGEFVLFLNSDATVTKQAIRHLLHAARTDENIGAVGPKILNADASLQPSVGYAPTLFRIASWMLFVDDIPGLSRFLTPYHVETGTSYAKPHDVGWVTGACMLVSRSAIGKTGGFHEHIFMYAEEVEWCYRIQKAGMRIVYTPDAVVYHLKGGSSKEGGDAGIAEEMRSLLVFYRKHEAAWKYPIVKMLLITGAWLRVKLFGIMGKYPKRRLIYANALEMVGRL